MLPPPLPHCYCLSFLFRVPLSMASAQFIQTGSRFNVSSHFLSSFITVALSIPYCSRFLTHCTDFFFLVLYSYFLGLHFIFAVCSVICVVAQTSNLLFLLLARVRVRQRRQLGAIIRVLTVRNAFRSIVDIVSLCSSAQVIIAPQVLCRMNSRLNAVPQVFSGNGCSGVRLDSAQPTFYFVMSGPFPSAHSAEQPQDFAGFTPSMQTAAPINDGIQRSFSFINSHDAPPQGYAMNQLFPFGSAVAPGHSLHSLPQSAQTFYAQPSPQPTAQQPAVRQQTISYLPAGAAETSTAGPVTYMIVNPNLVNQDTGSVPHYPAPSHTHQYTFQSGGPQAAHIPATMTLIQTSNQRSYAPAKGLNEPGLFLDLGVAMPTYMTTAAPTGTAVRAGNGSTIHAPLSPSYKSPSNPQVASSRTTDTHGGHGGAAASKGTQRHRRSAPLCASSSSSAIHGARSFVAPSPIGSRFVPNAPLIMSVPPLARRAPEWGVIPRGMSASTAVA